MGFLSLSLPTNSSANTHFLACCLIMTALTYGVLAQFISSTHAIKIHTRAKPKLASRICSLLYHLFSGCQRRGRTQSIKVINVNCCMKNALVKYLRCEERAREQRYKISSVSMICINGPHGPKNLHQQNNLFLELVQARSSLI